MPCGRLWAATGGGSCGADCTGGGVMGKRSRRDDDTGSLFRMLEDKLELERSFGVDVVPVGKKRSVAKEEMPVEQKRSEEALVGEPPVPQREGATASSSPLRPGEGLPRAQSRGKGEGVVVGAGGSKAERLAALEREMRDCMDCPLGATRTNLVFGVGDAEADILFIGEAPGADEDAQGEPFVGRAGQVLTRIINAMGLERSDVYIGNILKCRPPGNRNPRPSEVFHCLSYLREQVRIIEPKVIVCLGGVAAKTLLQINMPVGRMRGSWLDYEGIPVLVTFHPAYLLRNPAGKTTVWEDMKMVLHKLGLPIPER